MFVHKGNEMARTHLNNYSSAELRTELESREVFEKRKAKVNDLAEEFYNELRGFADGLGAISSTADDMLGDLARQIAEESVDE